MRANFRNTDPALPRYGSDFMTLEVVLRSLHHMALLSSQDTTKS